MAELAGRDYAGVDVSDEEWTRVFAAFGPHVPSQDELARRVRNPDLNAHGMELMRRLDVVDQLARITSPTLVCVGESSILSPPSVRHRRSSMRWTPRSRSSRCSRALATSPGWTALTSTGRCYRPSLR